MYADDTTLNNPVSGGGMDTQHVAGAVVVLSILALWAIRRGFRGVSVGGINVGIR
jgi:hypothetical protein